MSRAALRALVALVLLLAVAVALDRPRPASVHVSDRILPGLDVDGVRRVELLREGRPPVVVERAAGGGHTVDGYPADEDAVRELLGSLEYLSFRRRLPAGGHGLDRPRLRVVVVDDSGRRELAVGRSQPTLGRAWVSAGGASDFLVDESAARALDRDAPELRQRHPFVLDSGAISPVRLELTGGSVLELRGDPPCVPGPRGGCALADSRRTAALLDDLAALALTRFLDAAPGEAEAKITAASQTLELLGACPGAADQRAVRSAAGAGCLTGRSVEPLLALSTDPLVWVERRITSLEPGAIDHVRAGDVELERRGGSWRRGEVEVSAEAVRDWLGRLASYRGEPSWVAPGPPPPGSPSIELAAGARHETLWLAPDAPVVRRADEPLALTVHPSVRAAFALDPVSLADRRVIEVDPSTLVAIRVEQPGAPPEVAARGTTLDDWRVTSPITVDADAGAVEALRRALAPLTAGSVVAAEARPGQGLDPPRRRITVTSAPAPGETEGHSATVELGATTGEGCFARRGGAALVYLLRPESCAPLAAHLATRGVLAVAPDEVEAVTIGGERLERHGADWYRPGGGRLARRDVEKLAASLGALAHAPEVIGYRAPAGGVPVVIEGPDGATTLRIGRDEYGRTDRPVSYRTPTEGCAFEPLCGGRP